VPARAEIESFAIGDCGAELAGAVIGWSAGSFKRA